MRPRAPPPSRWPPAVATAHCHATAFCRYGAAAPQHPTPACRRTAALHTAAPPRRRRTAALHTVAPPAPSYLRACAPAQLVASIVSKMDDKGITADLRRTYIQTLSAISRSGGYRLGKQLELVVPLVLQQCSPAKVRLRVGVSVWVTLTNPTPSPSPSPNPNPNPNPSPSPNLDPDPPRRAATPRCARRACRPSTR